MSTEVGDDRGPGRKTWAYRRELWSAALMAVTVALTAYSAYEATRWGGVQADEYAIAGSLRNQSNAALSTANTQTSYDAVTFGQFVFEFRGEVSSAADLDEARDLADALMRPEFLAYVDEWLALDPLGNPDAPRTPFELESYRNEAAEESERLVERAEEAIDEARDANQVSDDYILATVFFAGALFLVGSTTSSTAGTCRWRSSGWPRSRSSAVWCGC
jgi:hypothetical protein